MIQNCEKMSLSSFWWLQEQQSKSVGLKTSHTLTSGPRPALKTATGELLKHYGLRTVDFRCHGEALKSGFTVVDVMRPILSVSRLMDRGIETFIQTGKHSLRRFDGATVELTRRGVLYVLQCQVAVPMLLAPVDDDPAGEPPDLPPVDEGMERELMGREEVPPPVAIEVPAPGEPTSEERKRYGLTHLPYQSWCNVCVRARGRENRHESRSQAQPGTPQQGTPGHPMRLQLPEDRGRRANDHSLGSHRYSVQTDGCHPS